MLVVLAANTVAPRGGAGASSAVMAARSAGPGGSRPPAAGGNVSRPAPSMASRRPRYWRARPRCPDARRLRPHASGRARPGTSVASRAPPTLSTSTYQRGAGPTGVRRTRPACAPPRPRGSERPRAAPRAHHAVRAPGPQEFPTRLRPRSEAARHSIRCGGRPPPERPDAPHDHLGQERIRRRSTDPRPRRPGAAAPACLVASAPGGWDGERNRVAGRPSTASMLGAADVRSVVEGAEVTERETPACSATSSSVGCRRGASSAMTS